MRAAGTFKAGLSDAVFMVPVWRLLLKYFLRKTMVCFFLFDLSCNSCSSIVRVWTDTAEVERVLESPQSGAVTVAGGC